jgi:hypothetical protein
MSGGASLSVTALHPTFRDPSLPGSSVPRRPWAAHVRTDRRRGPDRTAAVGVIRTARRHAIIGLAVLLALGVAIAANVAQQRAPIGVSLAAVADHQGQWTGRRVRVTGRVAEFQDPGAPAYAVIEDADNNRIGLRDAASWRGLVGKQVAAVGTVALDPHFGLCLAGARLTRLRHPDGAPPTPAPH